MPTGSTSIHTWTWIDSPTIPRPAPTYIQEYWEEHPNTLWALGQSWQTVTIGDIIVPFDQSTASGRHSRRQWRISSIDTGANNGRGSVILQPRRNDRNAPNYLVIPIYWNGSRPELDAAIVWRSGRVPRRESKPYYSSRRRRYADKREYIHASHT